jgi:hypothetical protein
VSAVGGGGFLARPAVTEGEPGKRARARVGAAAAVNHDVAVKVRQRGFLSSLQATSATD